MSGSLAVPEHCSTRAALLATRSLRFVTIFVRLGEEVIVYTLRPPAKSGLFCVPSRTVSAQFGI